MWLVVGLGNPGSLYENTRHNVGFMVIDILTSKSRISLSEKEKTFIAGRGQVDDAQAVLMKPLTFMNRSGIAVRNALDRYDDIQRILVIHDDLDLDVGIIRIRRKGSSGGHRGIESIIETIGTGAFIRLKIGIGRSERIPSEEYVLSPFKKKEREVVDEALLNAADAVRLILDRGVSRAQNEYHQDR